MMSHLPVASPRGPALETLEPRLLLTAVVNLPFANGPVPLWEDLLIDVVIEDVFSPFDNTVPSNILAVNPWLFSGNVTLRVVNGVLVIAGDDLDNGIVIDQTGLEGDQFRIMASQDSATTINGQADPLIVGGVTSGIRISLHDGDDLVELTDLSLQGDLNINGGKGDDSIWLDLVTISQTLTINNSDSGDDYVALEYSTIARDVTIAGGGESGDDVDIDGVTIGGDLAVSNSSKPDEGYSYLYLIDSNIGGNVRVTNSKGDSDTTIEATLIGGKLTVKNRNGYDQFTLSEGSSVHGNVTIDHGAGDSETNLESATIGGNLVFTSKGGYDAWYESYYTVTLNLSDSEIDGAVTISTGRSYSEIEIDDVSIGGSLSVSSAGGYDRVNDIYCTFALSLNDSQVGEDVMIRSGRSDSEIDIDGVIVGGNVTVRCGRSDLNQIWVYSSKVGGNLSVKSRNSEDSVDIFKVAVAGKLIVITGGGDDEVAIDDSSVTGRSVIKTGSGDDWIGFDTWFDSDILAGVQDNQDITLFGDALPGGSATTFTGKLTLRTGSGDDKVVLGLSETLGNATRFDAPMAFNGGRGDDSVRILTAGNLGADAVSSLSYRAFEVVQFDTSNAWWEDDSSGTNVVLQIDPILIPELPFIVQIPKIYTSGSFISGFVMVEGPGLRLSNWQSGNLSNRKSDQSDPLIAIPSSAVIASLFLAR